MKTDSERLIRLHRRAAELKDQRERRGIALSGGVSLVFAVLLIAALTKTDRFYQSVTGSGFTGSSLLSDSTGGYILAAVIAFFVGVILTAVIYKIRKRR
ncbi:MAG: hypothetical protein IKF07_02280 [Eubacterium sp.]|nr:hypothetical protein [Eubacterium sp.]